jgi:hypothetical protein
LPALPFSAAGVLPHSCLKNSSFKKLFKVRNGKMMMRKLKKKIKHEDFSCITFVNLDLSKTRSIDGLAKYFSYCLKGIDDEHLFRSDISLIKSEIIEGIERLKRFQKSMKQFINYSVAQVKSDQSPIEEHHKLRRFIERKAEKITRDYKIGHDIIENFVMPLLCDDMMILDNEDYWDRLVNCSECNNIFIAKTSRHQMYCSKKCRDKHRNKERIKSGKWARYMKDWRRRSNKIAA